MQVGRTNAAAARGVALFLGAVFALSAVRTGVFGTWDATVWWLDFRPLPEWVGVAASAMAAGILLALAVKPAVSGVRRSVTLAMAVALMAFAIGNGLTFYRLLAAGAIRSAAPVPVSAFVAAALGIVAVSAMRVRDGREANRGWRGVAWALVTCAVCAAVFPVLQMVCFGWTDYRRSGDAIVVLGARVYADGRASQALRERVNTACELYREGYAPKLVFSGGPGEGKVHETEAMRALAISRGVPTDAIVLDRGGVNTAATARNASGMLDAMGAGRVLVVTHFYHLARTKLAFQQAGREVYTVPARPERTLSGLAWFMAREDVAFWAYYLRGV